VWDDAWKYTPDDQPCMRIWFDGEKGNPNDNIARLKVQQLMGYGNIGVKGKGSLILNLILTAVFMIIFV
jgi:hypothetical protein